MERQEQELAMSEMHTSFSVRFRTGRFHLKSVASHTSPKFKCRFSTNNPLLETCPEKGFEPNQKATAQAPARIIPPIPRGNQEWPAFAFGILAFSTMAVES